MHAFCADSPRGPGKATLGAADPSSKGKLSSHQGFMNRRDANCTKHRFALPDEASGVIVTNEPPHRTFTFRQARSQVRFHLLRCQPNTQMRTSDPAEGGTPRPPQLGDSSIPHHVLASKPSSYPMADTDCRGPAPADPGYSKRGRRRQGSGYNSFN